MAVLPRVAPAGVEPAPSRVRTGSSAELSYGAAMWPAGIEPAAPRVSDGRSTGELQPRVWARLDSNQRQLVCRTSALAAELLAREIRDKGSNLDLHVQGVASCRLDDPGMHFSVRFSMPLAYPSTLDRRPRPRSPSYVEGLWSPSSGAPVGKSQAKAYAYLPAALHAVAH